MAPSNNDYDSVVRRSFGSTFTNKGASEFQKHLDTLPTGNLYGKWNWVDNNGSKIYFTGS
tara:strand:- start:1044 stop:1223 length:180 start_codon:yes stop_codon:yes gene_type:complete